MIYKIPVYCEVLVEGSFDPSKLSAAVEDVLSGHINKVLDENGKFPLSTSDWFDGTAERIQKRTGTKKVTISLISKSQVLKRLSDHE